MSNQPKRFLLLMALALLALAPFCASPANATPTVQITNVSRGGSVNFWTPDTWRIDITGGAAYQDVMVCGTHNGQSMGCSVYGQTDGNGDFTMSGGLDNSTIGTWTETWYVGSTQATPGLLFYVWGTPCTFDYAAASPSTMVVWDYYYSQQQYPDYTAPWGSSELVASVKTDNGCHMTSSSFYPPAWPAQIDATYVGLTESAAQWEAFDAQYYNAWNRCFTCSYQIEQQAHIQAWALDVDDNPYYVYVYVTLIVNQTW